VTLLFQSPVLWEQVLCTAKVDGYSAHRCSGCAQMHSSKLLLVDLPLLHVMVDLLLLLWSRKGLNMAVELGAQMIKKTLLVRKNPWHFLSLLTSINPTVISSPAFNPNVISHHHLCISWWDTSQLNVISPSKTLAP